MKLQTVLLQSARIEKVTPPTPVKASPDNEKTEAQILPRDAGASGTSST